MVLNVKVGIVSSISLISPYGNNPNFTNAWNPLQIPNINPSFSYRCLWIKSFSFGFLKILLMNFPEPSGSSPALNPPGNMMICAFSISFANNSIESCISCGFKFLNTTVLTLAPASSNAFAESYSQFVPGNTGMNTWGLVIGNFLVIVGVFWLKIFLASPFCSTLVGNTFSNGSSQSLINSSKSNTTFSFTTIAFSLVVVPNNSNFALSISSATSKTNEPYNGVNKSSVLLNLNPILFPIQLFVITSAIPPFLIVLDDKTFPSLINLCTNSKFSFKSSKSMIFSFPIFVFNTYTFEFAFLNSFETTFVVSTSPIQKDTNVGGTSSSLYEPDILSFPPIAAICNCSCT